MDMILGLLKKAMDTDATSKGFLIEGFPQGQGESQKLVAAFEKKIGRPKMVIFLDCPKDVTQKRAIQKSAEKPEDNKTVILKFATTEADDMPVVEFYEKIDPTMVQRLSAIPDPDEVYEQVYKAISKPKMKKGRSM